MDIRKVGQELNNPLGGGLGDIGILLLHKADPLASGSTDTILLRGIAAARTLTASAGGCSRTSGSGGTGTSSAANRTQVQCSSGVPADGLNENETRDGCDKSKVRIQH